MRLGRNLHATDHALAAMAMNDHQALGTTPHRSFRPGADARIDYLQAPFLIRNAKQIYLAGTLPDDAVAALLPKGLKAAPGNTCILAFLDCPEGWEITPFRGFYGGIVIEGHDAPDGTQGVFMFAGSYSGKAGTHIKSQINARFEVGEPEFSHRDDQASARATLEGGSVAVEVTVSPDPPGYLSGTRLYLGVDPAARLRVWTVAFSTPVHPVSINRLTFNFARGHRLSILDGFKLEWAALCVDKSMTFGGVRFAEEMTSDGETIARQTGLLDVFDRLGRPAAVVDRGGAVRFVNAEAERVGIGLSALRATNAERQRALRDALGEAVAREPGVSLWTFPLAGEPARLVQISALHPSIAGDDAALAVFIEPAQAPRPCAPGLLELLGLTAAEARVAALVGGGRAPRDAATELGVTDNTVRSALKLVFDKLGISRQSELARIVSRLE